MNIEIVKETKLPDDLRPYQYIVIVDTYDEINLGTIGTLDHCKQWIHEYARQDHEEVNCYMIYELRAQALASLINGPNKSA